jgi:hypothetical protein
MSRPRRSNQPVFTSTKEAATAGRNATRPRSSSNPALDPEDDRSVWRGIYTHLGDGGEHDLYEGETPVERQGYVTDMRSERAVAFVEAAAAAPRPYFPSLHYTTPHGHGCRPQLKR